MKTENSPSNRERCGVSIDSEMLDINGLEIAVSRTGEGQPVVCLHAIGHGSMDYFRFTELVSNQFEVICIDWPNHGRSGQDKTPPSARYYSGLLDKVLRQLQISNPVIIGNSIGGAAAIGYAEHHDVRALILSNSAGLAPVNLLTRVTCRAYAAFFKAGAQHAPWFAWAYRQLYRTMVFPLHETASHRDMITASAYEMAPVLHQAWDGFSSRESHMAPILQRLTIPILFVWGKYDRVNPLWVNQPAIRRHQGSYMLSKFRCGHSPFLEVPEEFAESFARFMTNFNSDAASDS